MEAPWSGPPIKCYHRHIPSAGFGLAGTTFHAAEDFGRLVHKLDNCRARRWSKAQDVSLRPTISDFAAIDFAMNMSSL